MYVKNHGMIIHLRLSVQCNEHYDIECIGMNIDEYQLEQSKEIYNLCCKISEQCMQHFNQILADMKL